MIKQQNWRFLLTRLNHCSLINLETYLAFVYCVLSLTRQEWKVQYCCTIFFIWIRLKFPMICLWLGIHFGLPPRFVCFWWLCFLLPSVVILCVSTMVERHNSCTETVIGLWIRGKDAEEKKEEKIRLKCGDMMNGWAADAAWTDIPTYEIYFIDPYCF